MNNMNSTDNCTKDSGHYFGSNKLMGIDPTLPAPYQGIWAIVCTHCGAEKVSK